MYGFNVIIGAKGTESCKARLQYRNVIFESNMIDKFQDDKLFFENDNYLIVLDGVTLNKSETLSPFLDLDFLDTCFSIPLKYREYHKIYKKWILAKYPKAADYVWERMKCRITAPTINVAGGIVPLQRIFVGSSQIVLYITEIK